MKPVRFFCLLLAATAAVSLPAKQAPDTRLELPVNATDAAAKKYLSEIQRMLQDEMARVHDQAVMHGTAKTDPAVIEDAKRLISDAAQSHLAVVCEAAVQSEFDRSAPMYFMQLVGAVNERTEFKPAEKEIILKYLPKLPGLIATVDRMQWFEGADAAVAAGWKKASGDERDGMLTAASSRYATIAARRGITDALIAIAHTVRNPKADKRRGQPLPNEIATLKALVPSETDDPNALADFVLKNKSKLVFDAAKPCYRLAR
jgi:hypothetical protein